MHGLFFLFSFISYVLSLLCCITSCQVEKPWLTLPVHLLALDLSMFLLAVKITRTNVLFMTPLREDPQGSPGHSITPHTLYRRGG
jgi:hypothetical protein